jgi:hypothetical protein
MSCLLHDKSPSDRINLAEVYYINDFTSNSIFYDYFHSLITNYICFSKHEASLPMLDFVLGIRQKVKSFDKSTSVLSGIAYSRLVKLFSCVHCSLQLGKRTISVLWVNKRPGIRAHSAPDFPDFNCDKPAGFGSQRDRTNLSKLNCRSVLAPLASYYIIIFKVLVWYCELYIIFLTLGANTLDCHVRIRVIYRPFEWKMFIR